ncbi:MAG: hypothetical protein IPP15_06070 [Saprospiraceae bacterium]|uniref:Uncharacterized protein n=1 Tax=Candidatus Opimibacter skivensis TaxID=2982028 RepID=A0A9D7SU99_9BACT|nr:hypothetical protein [Candidatus Opimibacter skivensis]
MPKLNATQMKDLQSGSTVKARVDKMRAVQFQKEHIKQALDFSENTNATDLQLTSQAILLRSLTGDTNEAFELASWSLKAKPASRKIVVGNFIETKQSFSLINQIAKMKRADASLIMKDYFGKGGEMEDVAEWLSQAGHILKTGKVPGGTDGFFDDLVDFAGDVVDAVVGAITTVADAIAEAGRNLAEAVAAVVSWTQSKINDFVEALIRAGRTVGELLTEALKESVQAVTKFIQAVIEAGRAGVEVLNWAVSKAANVLQSALQKLEQLFGSFTTLLIEIGKMAAAHLAAVVRNLLALGKRVTDFIERLDRLVYAAAKRIVEEIKRAGKTVAEIMNAIVNRTRHIASIVMDALLSLGSTIRNLLNEVINRSAEVLSKILGALKDMGRSLSHILDAIATFATQAAKKLMQAVRTIWTVLKEVLEFIAEKTIHVVKTLLVALIGTGIYIKDLLSEIVVKVRAAFRQGLIKGLIEIGYSILVLMKEAVKISASAAAVLFAILLDILGKHRGLTPAERAEAMKVFGSSINLDMVRLTDASFAADFIMWLNKSRPFTTVYVINIPSGSALQMHDLIHELTHIWQAVHTGGVYMLEALHSQAFGAGYRLTDTDMTNANGDFDNLEREQQATLVEYFWQMEFNGETLPLSIDLMRPLAKQVYKTPTGVRRHFEFDVNLLGRRRVAPIASAII